MYVAVLLVLLPLLINRFTWFRILAFVLALISMFLKMFYEENHLKVHHAAYHAYQKKTWRMIPYIF